ncbi:MAG: Phosphoesterase domain-containing protein [Candidatus Shapirobacteria bacterium GW2011_GWE1_38_10]|uniref:Phosphoesterase domain-containing protein n=1 Tax=Candidatus Shapirobacteria bacterium GW2011_GWE1_38_10 TaxID=1618488 RepID=A0A0G0I4X5_9BACT|nr:MAG: Phosphoesterase domain-containing protein [Candidatus Shapirobacteria bacterium GW2011_GWE1_38_10]
MPSIPQQIKSAIDKSRHVLLHLHPGPDADSVGSVLAFFHYLKSINKDVTLISGDSNLSPNLMTLPGADQILSKNYFDIEVKDYDLFIILDSSETRQISKLKKVVFPKALNTIVVDHHASNTGFGQINLIDKTSPATCQILFELFTELKIKITSEIATCLFAGIYADSGGFKYSSTSSKTFSICAKLTKIAPNFSQTIFNLENNDRPERPKLLGLHLNNIKTYFNYRVAISALPQKLVYKNNLNSDDSVNSEIANTLKSVVGWEIGISMIEAGKNKVKVSFRTRDSEKFDVAAIASATGFGGGHMAAAGALIPQPLTKAKRLVLRAISRLHPELGKA